VSHSTRTQLKQILVAHYTALRRKLEFVAGSRDGATDALHETWVRLETMGEAGPVANPDAYLIRMATNVAIDQHRRERRHLHESEVGDLFETADELADPARILAGRREVSALEDVLRDLTPRRRAILLAARIDGQLNPEIAERFGLSLRVVERELSYALKYCNERMWPMRAASRRPAREAQEP
jgi:RNA polymerase sigma factor (sigma-70 family)